MADILKASETEIREAAERGDPGTLLRILHETGVFAGFVNGVQAKWGSFDRTVAHTLVASAVDIYYDAVRCGKRIDHPLGYIYKTIQNLACEESERRSLLVTYDDSEESATASQEEDQPPDLPRAELKRKALGMARQLLPQLGQTNVQRVMALLFDAVEKGIVDLPTGDIAEVLDLNPDTVRQCVSRGFRRLRRLSDANGVSLDSVLTEIDMNDKWEKHDEE